MCSVYKKRTHTCTQVAIFCSWLHCYFPSYCFLFFFYVVFAAGPQREIFPGATKVDTGPPNFIGPSKPYRGPCRKIIFRPSTKLAQNFFPIFCPKSVKSKKKTSSLKFSPNFCPKNDEEQNVTRKPELFRAP